MDDCYERPDPHASGSLVGAVFVTAAFKEYIQGK
jgi:hypothetical protein